jgi:hypothetical protein
MISSAVALAAKYALILSIYCCASLCVGSFDLLKFCLSVSEAVIVVVLDGLFEGTILL